jgi:alpha-tubulin suppressor-like RCC1 family protein
MTAILNIIEIIVDKITNSTTEQEFLFLSKIIEKLNVNKVKTVTLYTDMFDDSYTYGDLYFVETENSLYYSFGPNRLKVVEGSPSLFSFGENGSGQLGDNTGIGKQSPVSVVGGFTDWIYSSSGFSHNHVIRSNGTLWGWGYNGNGRIGDNTVTVRSSPVSVVGGFTDWTEVSAGNAFSLGLRANGTAWAWGNNTRGQLGDETIVSKLSPVSVVGGYVDWIQVSAGPASFPHSVGLRANGTAWSWGNNGNGQLGDNTLVSKSSPVSVVGGFTDWTQVSAGGYHSLGIRENGTAWAWGANTNGRLGDNTTVGKSSPVSVVGGYTDWVQVSAGDRHNLGIRANGTAWAWGYNLYGRLGDGTTVSKSSPVSVVGGFTDWVQVSANIHSVGLRLNGTAWGWGGNGSGRLGDGTVTSRLSPASVIGGFGNFNDWVQLNAGGAFSVGIRTL